MDSNEQLQTFIRGKKSAYVIYLHLSHPNHSDPIYAIYEVSLPETSDDSSSSSPVCPTSNTQLLSPIITLGTPGYPLGAGFGCIGSSIYMIAGEQEDSRPSLSVYIFDTDQIPIGTTSIIHLNDPESDQFASSSSSFLRIGPPLRAPKTDPTVVSMQGKIYVIPFDFDGVEYIDSCSNEWKLIPAPIYDPRYIDNSETPELLHCSVMRSSILCNIDLGVRLLYELDGNHPSKGWELSSKYNFFQKCGTSSNSQVVNDFLFPPRPLTGDNGRLDAIDLLELQKRELLQHYGASQVEFISINIQPRNGKIGGGIVDGIRSLLNIGDGLYVIFSDGFTDISDEIVRIEGEVQFTFDVVRFKGTHGGGEEKS